MTSDEQIAKLKAEITRLKAAISTDPLTGLQNRRGLRERLLPMVKEVSYQLANPQRRRVQIDSLAIVMVDIDFFKKINDEHGHETGDRVLKQLSKVLLGHVRSLDVVGRMGGEEFAVGLLGASPKMAAKVAEQLREAVVAADFTTKDGTKLTVTASFGVTSLTTAKLTLDDLLDQADKALYEAKTSGRNRVAVYKA